ncbi:ArgE/DapE family deacylase [Lactobacillus intestinalis]|uniref:Probable succinyl-diaminopimelate desuccinylase n=1 Tax=Lactobacillus intestinalis TaxID=151781 RepID=A0A4S2BNA2_9LACO|nr:ArgE/DapE family deacylase [Lactobacillus intestinalis]KAI4315884.1 putative succinyl-diaminopimelate desuccinylase [Lactobacillus intestinalis]TGY16526.1 ArgE/DapE family deacylase [Lactobacillus intestinalis]
MDTVKNSFTDDEELKILQDLIAIHSVNNHEMEVARYLQKLLKKHDISAKILRFSETRGDLIAEIGSGKPVLGLSGHMDVVAAGDLSQWKTDPFILTNIDGKLYGRGATDMKAGLAAMVLAMISIHDHHLLKHGTLRLMASFGEEIGEQGSKLLKNKGYMRDVDALLIGEPTGYQIAIAHKGSMDVRFTSHGTEAHSSRPQNGYNAINPLMKLLIEANRFFNHSLKTNSQLGKLTFSTTIFNGGDQVNSIPALAQAEANIRTIPEFNNAEVEKNLKEMIAKQNKAGAKVDLDVYMSEPSIETNGQSKFIKLAQKIGAEFVGKAIPTFALNPVTDASNLIIDKGPDFPLAIFGPGNDTPHQVNEYVDQEMYLKFIDIYIALFSAYLNN